MYNHPGNPRVILGPLWCVLEPQEGWVGLDGPSRAGGTRGGNEPCSPWEQRGPEETSYFPFGSRHWNILSCLSWDPAEDAPGLGLILRLASTKERGGRGGSPTSPCPWAGPEYRSGDHSLKVSCWPGILSRCPWPICRPVGGLGEGEDRAGGQGPGQEPCWGEASSPARPPPAPVVPELGRGGHRLPKPSS